MPLWKNTDAEASKPKYLSAADKAKAFFVSKEEALLGTNKAKGITGAGWWLINEYTDASGNTRYKAENLIAMTVANAISGDANDDAKVSDVEVVITIATQPTDTPDDGDGDASFSVVASVNVGTLTYQWQKKDGSRWTNISGETNDTLVLAGLTVEDNGNQYRVVLGSDSGAKKVTSNAATLTVVR